MALTDGILVRALDGLLGNRVGVVIRPPNVQDFGVAEGLVRHRDARKLRVCSETVTDERDALPVDHVDVLRHRGHVKGDTRHEQVPQGSDTISAKMQLQPRFDSEHSSSRETHQSRNYHDEKTV